MERKRSWCRMIWLVLGMLVVLALSGPAVAHNGAVAIAVPVEGITVDGDLSDWPEGMREYPISSVLGEQSGSFRIGYRTGKHADFLYLGIEILDDNFKPYNEYMDNFQDACLLLFDFENLQLILMRNLVIIRNFCQFFVPSNIPIA